MESTQLITQAREAIQANDKPKARQLLHQVVQQEPHNYAAWLWLARVAASPAASMAYVKRAEKLQPNHPTVQKAKAWAERRRAIATTAPSQATATPAWPKWAIVGGLGLVVLLLAGVAGFFFGNQASGETAVSAPIAIANENVANENVDAAENGLSQSNLAELQVESAESQPDETDAEPVAEAENPIGKQEAEAELIVPAVDATPEPTERPERILAKNLSSQSLPRAQWTATPVPTNTPVPTPTIAPTFVAQTNAWVGTRPLGVGINERWIDVNLTTQTLTAYEGDTLIFTSVISSGTANHRTVTGQFRTWLKYESQTMDGRRLGYDYYVENVPYVMYFYNDYAIHGAYWHDNFGTPMSHGCVNMTVADSEWLYNWAGLGTLVNVHY
ncbi:MAG: L,D-transpeptidase family protein [Chloroflexota bacterium]